MLYSVILDTSIAKFESMFNEKNILLDNMDVLLTSVRLFYKEIGCSIRYVGIIYKEKLNSIHERILIIKWQVSPHLEPNSSSHNYSLLIFHFTLLLTKAFHHRFLRSFLGEKYLNKNNPSCKKTRKLLIISLCMGVYLLAAGTAEFHTIWFQKRDCFNGWIWVTKAKRGHKTEKD